MFSDLIPTRSATLALSASDGSLVTATSSTFAVTGDPAMIAAGSAGTDPNVNAVSIQGSSVNSKSTIINLLGPAPSDSVTFTISCIVSTVSTTAASIAPPGCSTSLASTMGTDGIAAGTTAGVTPIAVTLSVVRAAVPPADHNDPFLPGPRIDLAALKLLALMIVLGLIGLAWIEFDSTSSRRTRRGFAFVFLLCLCVRWMAACSQFPAPSTPTTPIPPTVTGAGTAVVTITPNGAGPGSDSYGTQKVTIYFNVQ